MSLQGLAFGMLKSHGTGVKFLRGSGFVIGRSVNSRRETRWSAPSYFTIDIRGLPPAFRSACSNLLIKHGQGCRASVSVITFLEQMHLMMVLPGGAARDSASQLAHETIASAATIFFGACAADMKQVHLVMVLPARTHCEHGNKAML